MNKTKLSLILAILISLMLVTVIFKFGFSTSHNRDYSLYSENSAKSIEEAALNMHRLGKYQRAVELWNQSIKLNVDAIGPYSKKVAVNLVFLARTYVKMGAKLEAILTYERALSIEKKISPKDYPTIAIILIELGDVASINGEYMKAESFYKEAIALQNRLPDTKGSTIARGYIGLANVYQKDHEYTKSERLYKDAITILEKNYGENHPELIAPLKNLGIVLVFSDKYNEAEPIINRAISLNELNHGAQNIQEIDLLRRLNYIYMLQDRYQDGELALRKALLIAEKLNNKTALLLSLIALGNHFTHRSDHVAAISFLKSAREIVEKFPGRIEKDALLQAYISLAIGYKSSGDRDNAELFYARVTSILENTKNAEYEKQNASGNFKTLFNEVPIP